MQKQMPCPDEDLAASSQKKVGACDQVPAKHFGVQSLQKAQEGQVKRYVKIRSGAKPSTAGKQAKSSLKELHHPSKNQALPLLHNTVI